MLNNNTTTRSACCLRHPSQGRVCGGVCEDMGAAMGGKGAGANNRGQELLQGPWRAPVGLGTLLQWGKLYPGEGSVRSTFNIMSPITGLIFVGASTSAMRCYLALVVQVNLQQRAEQK